MAKSKEMQVEFITDYGFSEDTPNKGDIVVLPVDEAKKLIAMGVAKESNIQVTEESLLKIKCVELTDRVKELEGSAKKTDSEHKKTVKDLEDAFQYANDEHKKGIETLEDALKDAAAPFKKRIKDLEKALKDAKVELPK